MRFPLLGAAACAAMLDVSAAWAAAFECLIQPNQIVDIRSRAEGLIAKVYVQRGDTVKTGQLLVELESSAERSAVATAKYRSDMAGRLGGGPGRVGGTPPHKRGGGE